MTILMLHPSYVQECYSFKSERQKFCPKSDSNQDDNTGEKNNNNVTHDRRL